MSESAGGRRAKRRRIEAEARCAFLAALRGGVQNGGAAAAAGFSLNGFYSLRRRDLAFRYAWDMARDLYEYEAAALRRAGAAGQEEEEGELRFAPNNSRRIQKRRMKHVVFTPARRATFLACFEATADAARAAAEAGVDVSTVYDARRSDADFAAAFDAALAESYVRLEAEAVRQRLAAQEAMKAAKTPPTIQMAEEFDRVMALLRRWDRGGGRAGVRETGKARLKRMGFDEAMALLAKRLTALGYKPGPPRPEQS